MAAPAKPHLGTLGDSLTAKLGRAGTGHPQTSNESVRAPLSPWRETSRAGGADDAGAAGEGFP